MVARRRIADPIADHRFRTGPSADWRHPIEVPPIVHDMQRFSWTGDAT